MIYRTFIVIVSMMPLLYAGCHRDMRDQPRYEVYEASTFFDDGTSARALVKGTVARGHLDDDDAFHTGRDGSQLLLEVPLKLDRELLERGRQRYGIYCAPCHGFVGDGKGIIVQRGFHPAASFETERLRNVPAGHIFDVMTHGFGPMPSFKAQITSRDRWAIIAYIRVLQMSQNAKLDDVPADERTTLEGGPP